MSFTGFSPESIQFLIDLSGHNNKEWFTAHKERYTQTLHEPLKALAADLEPFFQAVLPELPSQPRNVMSRISRDTRFSPNKLPYKTAVFLAYHRRVDRWTDTPTFFFDMNTEGYSYGMGFYQAGSKLMRAIRGQIDLQTQVFSEAIKPLNRVFSLYTDPYIREYPCEHTGIIRQYYQAKTFYLSASRNHDNTLFSPKLVGKLTGAFLKLKPLFDFLRNAEKEL